MRLFANVVRSVLLLGLGLLATSAGASPAAPQNGTEYRVLSSPQPTDTGKKIEVVEFFGYFCPHCNALEPQIEAWVKKQGDNIIFKRIHVNFHELVAQQKLFFTLEAMGKIDEYQPKVFAAYHVDHNSLRTDEDVMRFVSKSGLDKQKFSEIYNSVFFTQNKLTRAKQLMGAYQIDAVPSIAVDGRFVTSPAQAVSAVGRASEDSQNAAVLQVLDFLVAKAKKEKGVTTTEAAKKK
ncbi:thiol:disulfide interchange protein DsbA/DsbL [Undibacterium sp. Ji67W]|uniref:thiol:disulfide interchange protein DsbA/DsbL n=1 Tax=Undibacterium sp. Ji67W TaxID=3413042 RepID=UPI003BF2C551